VIHSQIVNGNNVYLLTLTKGGATQQRYKLGLSIEEMAEIRYREMQDVRKVLGLSGMEVLDFPDGKLKEMDVRVLEKAVQKHIMEIMPSIIVTYPIHGISGFHDHLVVHAVVKRVFLELRDLGVDFSKRLAFWTLPDSGKPIWRTGELPRLKLTEDDLIDCIVNLQEDDILAMKNALNCYVTYREVIEKNGVIEMTGNKAYFEIFAENFKPALDDLTKSMP